MKGSIHDAIIDQGPVLTVEQQRELLEPFTGNDVKTTMFCIPEDNLLVQMVLDQVSIRRVGM